MTKKTKIILLSAAAFGVVLAGVAALVWHELVVKSVVDETTWIHINDQSMIDNPTVLQRSEVSLLLRLMGYDKKLEAGRLSGAYKLTTGMSALTVARKVCHHQQDPVRLTLRPVRLKEQLAGRMGEVLMQDSVAFLDAMTSAPFLDEAETDVANVGAIFLPDTYEVYWTVEPLQLMRMMLKEYKKFWNEKRLAKAETLGLTPLQIATLASIAEEETADRMERGVVARLYWNRLQLGMLLQADPTVKFAVGDFGLKRILNRHLEVESPYNTYLNAGLPPGPIRIVEKATIDTLLNARPHDYLYMCAKPDFSGRHNFARSYDEHLRNAAAYHQALSK